MYLVDDMEVFARVVEARSFTQAGRELRVTTAVVSSRIARLERRLGVRLLHRTTRSVTPTEEGRVYLDHARRMLEEAERAEQTLAELRRRPAGALRVSAPVTLGRRRIAPLAPRFVADNDRLQLRLQLTDRVVDLVEDGVDLAIRTGRQPASSLIKRRLAPDLRVVAGAPAYFERRGAPQTPQELRGHDCLLLRFPGSQRYFWTFETRSGERFKQRLVGSFDSDSTDALIDWAFAGEGLVMTSVWDIAEPLRDGRLRAALKDWWPQELEISAVMPPQRNQPAKTRAFLDRLVETFRDAPEADLTKPDAVPLWTP